jgi:hypothetical protein
LQLWLDDEVAKPLDANEVAQSATDSAMASEMYLASVMLVDDQQDAERNYQDELAAALQIEPQLQVRLEQQAGALRPNRLRQQEPGDEGVTARVRKEPHVAREQAPSPPERVT